MKALSFTPVRKESAYMWKRLQFRHYSTKSNICMSKCRMKALTFDKYRKTANKTLSASQSWNLSFECQNRLKRLKTAFSGGWQIGWNVHRRKSVFIFLKAFSFLIRFQKIFIDKRDEMCIWKGFQIKAFTCFKFRNTKHKFSNILHSIKN